MGSVVALESFRQSQQEKDIGSSRPPRPEISGGEIWGRDYREVEAIVFGILKVRAILAHHMGTHDHVFDHLCIETLEAAYAIHDLGPANLRLAIKPLKEWILDEITDENKRDLSWSLVILDLIEKSPTK
ncbi:hypothetical protein [Pseudodesulfovibrio sp. zrk46]|uniref:hypothetical protein n=1 Tax=Pseudodesulfovibrio sp. zrk46 TaxID=2725288 RepID=UPI00144976E8|nr:hypothetical protein [Pseudodesulfovibrio sp. zrk46]QJB56117.1 hypothetical protein HFN16_06695 [Pseudodesulfovibrio sp. zrk46]